LLQDWSNGDETALEHLYPLVEAELKKRARNYLKREGYGHILQTTALINETFMRLIDGKTVQWQNRTHFFAVAAMKMRHILVEHARKRTLGRQVAISGVESKPEPQDANLIALDDALEILAKIEPRKSKVVVLHFFGGLSHQEIADVLNVSYYTVARDWRFAKAWLYNYLSKQ